MLYLFIIFSLSACQKTNSILPAEEVECTIPDENNINLNFDDETGTLVSDEEAENTATDEGNELIVVEFAGIGEPFVFITDFEDVSLDDFVNTPILSERTNDMVRRAIVDIILYTFDFEMDYSEIQAFVDEEASKDWFAVVFRSWISQLPDEREGMSIIDKINIVRGNNRDSSISLDAIQSNFMMRSMLDGDYLFVSVPVWRSINGVELGHALYEFEFKKIDCYYKVIGLALGA